MTKDRIMIVEDEFIIQTEMKIRLQKMGYQVVALASKGEEAINIAGEICPDLILMDIQLDGSMDGIEAAIIIRKRFGIPVVYMTAYSDEEKIERAKFSAPYGYLVKPVQSQELRITIHLAVYAAKLEIARKKAEKELQNTVSELQDALKTIKKLSGLLPICASCKKVRDDSGYWSQIETYIEAHSEAFFSHSVCPECAEKLYGQSKWFKKRNKNSKS